MTESPGFVLEEQNLAIERASFEATFRALRRSTAVGSLTGVTVVGALLIGADVETATVVVFCVVNVFFRLAAVIAAHLGLQTTDQRARRKAMGVLELSLVPIGFMAGGAALLPEQSGDEVSPMWFGLLLCAATVVAANILIGHGRTRPFLALALPLLATSVLSCLHIGGTLGILFAMGSIGVAIMFIANNREAGGVFREAQRYQFQNQALVAELEAANARLHEMACIDALTGIDNRVGLESRLHRAGRRTKPLAVGYIDLDGFKKINDRYGHSAGDRALQVVAERLVASLRETDMIARLGGDEFLALIEVSSDSEANSVADRLRECFAEPVDIGPAMVQMRASVGVVIASANDDLEMVVDRADTVMYDEKLERSAHTD